MESSRVSFFRVLSSALLRLDHVLFGRWAVVYHLHSLLWLGCLLILAWRFYRRLLPRLAPLVLLLFAVDECHGIPAGWIANRHAMVSMTLGLLGLMAHLRWREDGWRPGQPLCVTGYILALLAGEAGLGALAYAGAYEVLAATGHGWRRWAGLVPLAMIGAAYVTWYKVMGYGFKASGFYIDPGGQPLEFLRASLGRVPALLGNALTGVPPDMWWERLLRPWLVATGILGIGILAAVLRLAWSSFDDERRRHLRWLAGGSLLSAIPLAAAFPSARQLLAPMLGLTPLLAVFLETLWQRRPAAGFSRWAVTGAVGIVLMVHLILAPVQRVLAPQLPAQLHARIIGQLEQIQKWDPKDGYREVIVLNCPEIFTLINGPLMLDYLHATHRERWHALTAAPHDHRLTRTAPNVVELEVIDGEMLASTLEAAWPADETLGPGKKIDRGFLQAEILETGATGPTRVRFSFAANLDDPELLILRWTENGFSEVSMPPVGETLLLTHRISSPYPGLGEIR